MNFMCILNLDIFLFLLSLFAKTYTQGCDSDGFTCINCTDYKKCITGFSEGAIISCKSGSSCADVKLKQCQLKLNCFALNECTQAGIFPDVMVDSNYYVCLNDASSGFLKYEFSCPEENFFDNSTLTCIPRSATPSTTVAPTSPVTVTDLTSTSAPTTVAPTSPITVTDLTSTSAPTTVAPTSPITVTDLTTPSTLTMTIPSLSTSESTLSSTKLTTASSPQPSISTTLPSTPPETPPFVCPAAGIFPNLGNCKMYYRCSTSLKVFSYICPGSSYFNENILKCSLIITPACQEQILRNSSSIPPSVTPTTPTIPSTPITRTTPTTLSTPITPTTPTTTVKSTITSASTTVSSTTISTILPSSTITTSPQTTPTTVSPPSSPISCPTAGTFSDPLNCKTYYRCSLSGKIFHYECPGNSYYNEITQRCSLIITPRCRNLIQG